MSSSYEGLVDEELEILRSGLGDPQHSNFRKEARFFNSKMQTSFSRGQIILMQYDIAKMFRERVTQEGTRETAPLPFSQCLFEFLVDNKSVFCLVGECQGGQSRGKQFISIAHSEVKESYTFTDYMLEDNVYKQAASDYENLSKITQQPLIERAKTQALFLFVHEQIVAFCDAVDLGLFELKSSESKPLANTSKRLIDRIPTMSLHRIAIVKSNANTSHNPEKAASGTDNAKMRLHVRRGHYHHFRTRSGLIRKWVKPCWVGNPDLGFVEKEYRLGQLQ